MNRTLSSLAVAAIAAIAVAGCGSSGSTTKASPPATPPSSSHPVAPAPKAFTPEPPPSTPTDSPAYRGYVARLLEQQHHMSTAGAMKIAACEARKFSAAGYKTVEAVDKGLTKNPGKFAQFRQECGLLTR